MPKMLFTSTRPAGTDYGDIYADIEALELAFRREVPAFYVSEWVRADNALAILISSMDGTPEYAFARLDGFKSGTITLKRVA